MLRNCTFTHRTISYFWASLRFFALLHNYHYAAAQRKRKSCLKNPKSLTDKLSSTQPFPLRSAKAPRLALFLLVFQSFDNVGQIPYRSLQHLGGLRNRAVQGTGQFGQVFFLSTDGS